MCFLCFCSIPQKGVQSHKKVKETVSITIQLGFGLLQVLVNSSSICTHISSCQQCREGYRWFSQSLKSWFVNSLNFSFLDLLCVPAKRWYVNSILFSTLLIWCSTASSPCQHYTVERWSCWIEDTIFSPKSIFLLDGEALLYHSNWWNQDGSHEWNFFCSNKVNSCRYFIKNPISQKFWMLVGNLELLSIGQE